MWRLETLGWVGALTGVRAGGGRVADPVAHATGGVRAGEAGSVTLHSTLPLYSGPDNRSVRVIRS